ncbi:MAG TPA: Ger(x)C family spore germination protein [Clostridiales bacterium]|nr:Ger(x)C family spore germination protein [Clostridiales bacterium]
MIKKCLCMLLVLSFLLPLSGCWNYRGLNEMIVIVGLAIDKNDSDGYKVTFETVDLNTSVKESGPKSKMIEAEGKTIFDAVRNAKKRVTSKLYLGQAQIVIISEELGREQDIEELIDWCMRDGECRETMYFLISQEKTAGEVLSAPGLDQPLISNEIKKILEADQTVTSSTISMELYQIFDRVRAQGKDLTLPAIHNIKNDGGTFCEINGIAVYKGSRLAGFLSSEETKYVLFVIDKVEGGLLILTPTGKVKETSLEISKNKTRTSFQHKDGKIIFTIKTETDVYLDEYMGKEDALSDKQTKAIEDAAEKMLEENIAAVIDTVQTKYNADIFGFGNKIYKKDFDFWQKQKDHWDEIFPNIEVNVESTVHILNTAAIRET